MSEEKKTIFVICAPDNKPWEDTVSFSRDQTVSIFLHKFGADAWKVLIPHHLHYGLMTAYEKVGFSVKEMSIVDE